ncbi:DNA-binding protein [Caproiciproducens galactitolivorans]|uniref:PPC domain-containing protein n=1 Tax=Caproiciproducens galactitolivorans TaxID=642589 RepID=A0A4Z0YEP7_9FIRM|nr:PPC domain-containing DNA-binding protein [Caproiciproducens galactitolivorans]QEY34543.1 DNA-binding protein [Caproiciproducens galactitolivorans]TGJ77671.1 hypothetical protein CAGA_00620 [Caproiciproducens galactitolivorans]
MEYKRIGDTLVARIDRGEEILQNLKTICEKENIRLASVSAIGAVDHAVIGLYRVEEKKYYKNTFDGEMEMTSLTGNVTEQEGQVYLHLHANFAGADGHVVGGHLNEAVISGTCEMFIRTLPGNVGRKPDDETGLNVFSL